MYLLEVEFGFSSLFSMRIPYTYQSALTYPLPPPTVLRGMAAWALARFEGTEPSAAMAEAESGLLWVTAAAVGPISVRSYLVRVIKVEGAKPPASDALPRQFGWAHGMAVWFLAEQEKITTRLREALLSTPVTMGDSESLCYPRRVGQVTMVTPRQGHAGEQVRTRAYVPKRLAEPAAGQPQLFWVRVGGGADPEQLEQYLFPVAQTHGRYEPTEMTIELSREAHVLTTWDGNSLVIPASGSG